MDTSDNKVFLLDKIKNEIAEIEEKGDIILGNLVLTAVIPKAVDYHNSVNKLKIENIECSMNIISGMKECYYQLESGIENFYAKQKKDDRNNKLDDEPLDNSLSVYVRISSVFSTYSEMRNYKTGIFSIVDHFFLEMKKKGYDPIIEYCNSGRQIIFKCEPL